MATGNTNLIENHMANMIISRGIRGKNKEFQNQNKINTNSSPREAIRRRRREGDRSWKKSLSGETTRTCHKTS